MNHQKGFISPLVLALIAVLLIGGGAYVYVQNKQANEPIATTSTAQTSKNTSATPSRLALDLANVTPQFIDENGYGGLKDGTPLPAFAVQIKKDIAAIFTPPDNKGYHLYSKAENIYLIAVGKRYVIFGDSLAKEGYSGELFDSVTNTSLPMGPWAAQIFHTNTFAVYVMPNSICTYTLDQPICITIPGSKLTESEGYWDTMGGSYGITETHTNTSLTVTDFSLATGKKSREMTFALPDSN